MADMVVSGIVQRGVQGLDRGEEAEVDEGGQVVDPMEGEEQEQEAEEEEEQEEEEEEETQLGLTKRKLVETTIERDEARMALRRAQKRVQYLNRQRKSVFLFMYYQQRV